MDTVLNKADNSNNKERDARITFSLRERKREGGMEECGMEEWKRRKEKGSKVKMNRYAYLSNTNVFRIRRILYELI